MSPEDDLELSSEDEAVASDLDMHALILGGLHQEPEEPLKTAEEVIREIDDMMQEDSSLEERSPGDSLLDTNETLEKAKEVLSSPLYEDSNNNNAKTQKAQINFFYFYRIARFEFVTAERIFHGTGGFDQGVL